MEQTHVFTHAETTVLGNIIKICSERGAFRADEFTIVGGIYNKIADILKESDSATAAPDTIVAPPVAVDNQIEFPTTGGPNFPL